jgi:hypothetical protein
MKQDQFLKKEGNLKMRGVSNGKFNESGRKHKAYNQVVNISYIRPFIG